MEIRTRYEEWPYRVVDSIFIGGGTPSLMPAEDMAAVLDTIRDCFMVSDDCEITIESNPATLDERKLNTYLESGINRISIGVQSFDNHILKMLGRVHDKNEAARAITTARRAGFDNINVDLMFGIPAQTMKMWKDSFRQCLFLEPEHISLYSLQIEENTPVYDMIYKDDIIKPVDEDTDRSMYHEALMMLSGRGYNLYEISNASKPGRECRHNLKYWSYEEYLGLGLGASSFIGGYRFRNTSKMKEYLKYIRAGMPPVKPEDVENYTKRDEMGIYVFTGLRKREGFDINEFESIFGVDFFKVYEPSLLDEFRGCLEVNGSVMRLTERGIDISNRIMAAFV